MALHIILAAAIAGLLGTHSFDRTPTSTSTSMVAFVVDEPILRGEPLGHSPVVSLRDIARHPKRFAGRTVIVEGTIKAVCQKKGCWMELKGRSAGLRVTFKDYGFFVPKDSRGKRVRAEGIVEVKTLSKADADHLAGEGASLRRNKDGTATEVGFVASGVEIR